MKANIVWLNTNIVWQTRMTWTPKLASTRSRYLAFADFDESGQRFQQVADKHFAKSRTAGSIEFRQPGCCYG